MMMWNGLTWFRWALINTITNNLSNKRRDISWLAECRWTVTEFLSISRREQCSYQNI